MAFNPFKMVVQFFKTASNFPNFDGPWPQLQKGKTWLIYQADTSASSLLAYDTNSFKVSKSNVLPH